MNTIDKNKVTVNPFLKNSETLVRGVEYLKDKYKRGNYDWDLEKMKPIAGDLYANKEIKASGRQNLLNGSSTQVVGVTNFDGNQLAKGRAFVATHVAFGFAEAPKGKPVSSVEYNFAQVPAYLNHANLILKQKDEVLVRLPILSIIGANGRGTETVYRELESFELIEDETKTELSIEFPEEMEANIDAANSLYVSTHFKGLETFLKR